MGAGYAWHQIDTRRALTLPGYTDTLTSSYRARTAQAFGEVAYAANAGRIALEPFLNLAIVHTTSGGFREKGGEAALAGKADTQRLAFTAAGLRAASQHDLPGGRLLTVSGALAWQHMIGGAPSARLQLQAGGAPFSVRGAALTRDSLNLDGGVAISAGKNAQLSLRYVSSWAARAQDQSLQLQWRMQF